MSDPRVAQPGDKDLDIEVTRSCVSTSTSSSRSTVDNDEGRVTVPHVENLELSIGWRPDGDVDEVLVDNFGEVIETWRANATPLRFAACPGKLGSLSANHDEWLPIPRTMHPDPEGPT